MLSLKIVFGMEDWGDWRRAQKRRENCMWKHRIQNDWFDRMSVAILFAKLANRHSTLF
jgi:hypothetical protein